jgi:hypothetical protein
MSAARMLVLAAHNACDIRDVDDIPHVNRDNVLRTGCSLMPREN